VISRLLSWLSTFRQRRRIASLLRLCQRYQVAYLNRDTKRAAELVKGLLLDERRIRTVFRKDVARETVTAVVNAHQAILKSSPECLAAQLEFRQDQTGLLIHAATTEELAAREPGSLAWEEFPGGTQDIAQTILRPGMMFYNVTFINPDERHGKQYQLFFWDGRRWGMLGPMWRVVE
jgi:hypothetical protein